MKNPNESTFLRVDSKSWLFPWIQCGFHEKGMSFSKRVDSVWKKLLQKKVEYTLLFCRIFIFLQPFVTRLCFNEFLLHHLFLAALQRKRRKRWTSNYPLKKPTAPPPPRKGSRLAKKSCVYDYDLKELTHWVIQALETFLLPLIYLLILKIHVHVRTVSTMLLLKSRKFLYRKKHEKIKNNEHHSKIV